MAIQVQTSEFSFRDAKGWIGKVRFHISGTVGTNTLDDYNSCASTLQTALTALTNAALQSTNNLPAVGEIGLTYGTNAQYPAEWMKAVFTFSTANGDISRFKVPAPKIGIMETDGITVINDGSNALVVAFVDAVKNADASGTYVSTSSGEAYAHFEGGIVRLGKQPRRFNGRVKSAKLVAGEGE